MSDKPAMDGLDRPRHEMRDTIIKSGLSGVAATVLAVTIWSPAGLGGMIGTSLASNLDAADSAASDVLANLARYPAPITAAELANIRAKLSDSAASLDASRAATDANIAHMRRLAATDSVLSVAPMTQIAQVGAGMAVTHQAIEAAPADAVVADFGTPGPVQVEYQAPPLELRGHQAMTLGVSDEGVVRDPNMELAALLFAL